MSEAEVKRAVRVLEMLEELEGDEFEKKSLVRQLLRAILNGENISDHAEAVLIVARKYKTK